MSFASSLLPRPEEHEIIDIKYFTARVNYDPAEPTAQMRQSVYLSALAAYRPQLKIIEGYYKRFRARYPFAKEPCKSCPKVPFATVWKTEEKRSDVNIAAQMFIDHIERNFDCIILVSGDTDLIAPLYYLKKNTGKSVIVFNPHERPSEELRAVSTYYKHIPRDLPAKYQLPDIIPVGTNGRTIHRPLREGRAPSRPCFPPPIRSLRANDSRQPNRLTPNHPCRNAFRRACPLGLLLALRAVDCRVERSVHGWSFCGDIIADLRFRVDRA